MLFSKLISKVLSMVEDNLLMTSGSLCQNIEIILSYLILDVKRNILFLIEYLQK